MPKSPTVQSKEVKRNNIVSLGHTLDGFGLNASVRNLFIRERMIIFMVLFLFPYCFASTRTFSIILKISLENKTHLLYSVQSGQETRRGPKRKCASSQKKKKKESHFFF
jgi:hypothetical protein